MLRLSVVASVGLTAGCFFPDTSGLSGSDGGAPPDATTGSDSAPDVGTDSGADADASTCTACTGLVSAYRFSDPNSLGLDFFAHNSMASIHGTPQQSTTTPNGLGGHSIELDGSSSVCIDSGFTFDSTADHTLCWWAQPAALANQTNQFAQTCGYDTWTTNSGADYLWHINNCNGGTAADLQVPGIYSIGTWVQICQTYVQASMTRTVVVNGQTSQKFTVTDTVPILELSSSSWCIGSYNLGGFWTGRIYLPMWFNRALGDTEIQQVYANACCLP